MRRPRFRLRSLLLAVAILAAGLGVALGWARYVAGLDDEAFGGLVAAAAVLALVLLPATLLLAAILAARRSSR